MAAAALLLEVLEAETLAALDRIFLEPGSPFYDLTLKYGVF